MSLSLSPSLFPSLPLLLNPDGASNFREAAPHAGAAGGQVEKLRLSLPPHLAVREIAGGRQRAANAPFA